MGINYFSFAGKMSTDFGVWISGEATYQSPSKDIETVVIPGRNGSLSIDNGRFQNINIPYNAYIIDDFERNFDALKAYLTSFTGYQRLADTYHPDYYRLARFYSAVDPEMTQLNRHGKFVLNFDCDPRRFLKSGEIPYTATSSDVMFNPTQFASAPLLRVYGTGTLTISGVSITITAADSYTDIDCELQEAYKDSVNCNSNIVLVNGKFPTMPAENNEISMSGISRVEITPRWWTI